MYKDTSICNYYNYHVRQLVTSHVGMYLMCYNIIAPSKHQDKKDLQADIWFVRAMFKL